MSERPDELIILGKTSVTPDEDLALEMFGYCMALLGQKLLTLPSRGAAMAVLAGYLAAGGTPNQLEKGELPHDNVIVFMDEPLKKALDKRMPDWVNRPWVIVDSDRIDEFASIYLAIVDGMGIDIVA